MKYSERFTLSIPMKEFYKFAKPLVGKEELHRAIRRELYMSWHGVVNGEWGGSALDWKEIFYKNLFKEGFIEQTQESIDWYGVFDKG